MGLNKVIKPLITYLQGCQIHGGSRGNYPVALVERAAWGQQSALFMKFICECHEIFMIS